MQATVENCLVTAKGRASFSVIPKTLICLRQTPFQIYSCPFVVTFQISLLTRMEQNFAPHMEQKCSPLRLPCNGVGEFRSLMAS